MDGWIRPLFTTLSPYWDVHALPHSCATKQTTLIEHSPIHTGSTKHTSHQHTYSSHSPHHCSIIRSNTLFTFKSKSRPKSVSTNGAAGGLSGRRLVDSVSSQSAGSKVAGARRFRELPVDDKGEVQRGSGGGAGATWVGAVVAGDGGSSSRREEHRGEDRQLSSLEWGWEGWDWSVWGDGEGPGGKCAGDLRSEASTVSAREEGARN